MGSGRRRASRIGRLVSCVSVALAALSGAAAAQQPVVALARTAPAAKPEATLKADSYRTRFIIGLESKVDFQVFSLTEPNRVYVDLPDIKLQLPGQPADGPVGLIKSFRGGLSAPGKARIVIDVTGPVIVEKAAVDVGNDGNSPRLVIDIVPASAAQAADMKAAQANKRAVMQAGASGLGANGLGASTLDAEAPLLQPPLPRPAVSPQARALGMYKPVIVLDPGHGGMDGGAVKLGTVEKNVVLAFSLKLREKLQATGRYKVLMTRDTDTFVELNARREFAERNMAALFVAVHADYAHAKARGATIYSLREVSANVLAGKDLSALANANAEGDLGAVKEILADLARREVDMTRGRTNVFVKSVIEFMGESTGMKDNPDRAAAFVVLKSAKVPSILIELGYVTNEADAELLKSEDWREKVATSITTAIENYFSHQLARLPM
jgi:N-acetylmuramoyl-L-alanine amidase